MIDIERITHYHDTEHGVRVYLDSGAELTVEGYLADVAEKIERARVSANGELADLSAKNRVLRAQVARLSRREIA